MQTDTTDSLLDYAIRLKADPRLLHLLVATAKRSDSPVIRYGAVALDKHGHVAGMGYSKMARTEAEKRWGDEYTPPRLHAEMGALCDAESKGYNVNDLQLFILPLSPANNPIIPEGYIVLRDMEHAPCFSCASCGPKLERLGINMNVLNGQRGWVTIPPHQAPIDGARLAELQSHTGLSCRAGLPGSVLAAPALDEPGYRYLPFPLNDMSQIGLSITAEQEANYTRAIAEHDLPSVMHGDIPLIAQGRQSARRTP